MAGPDDHQQMEQAPPRAGEDIERQRRLNALRKLAEHAVPAPSTSSTPTSERRPPSLRPPSGGLTSHSRNRWLAGIASALCVVVIAVVALTRLAAQPQSPTTRPAGPTVIRLTLTDMACPQDAVWSPDGTHLAVFGSNCGASDTLLNIYGAASGKVSAQANLTAITRQALQSYAQASQASSAYLPYFHGVLWTKQYLFLPFAVVDLSNPHGASPEATIPAQGLLGFNPDGAAPLQPTIGIVPMESGLDAYVTWDTNGFTSSFTAVHTDALVGPAPSHTRFSSLPPALGYNLRNLLPRPLTPLGYRTPPPSDPGGPIGDLTGDSQITIWQPGTLTYFPTLPGTSTPASMVLFDTNFAVLAPPFLDTNLTFEGRLVPPDRPAPDANALGAAGLLAPWLPIRDAALANVLTDVEHNAASGAGPAAIAWRPDGRRLAYQPGIAINDGGSNPRAHDVRIYDCKSGQVLATLTPPLSSGTPIRATNLLRWSPDGTKLMLLDRVDGEIVVWGYGQLPA